MRRITFGLLLIALLVGGLLADRALGERGHFGWCGALLIVLFGSAAIHELVGLLDKAGMPAPRGTWAVATLVLLLRLALHAGDLPGLEAAGPAIEAALVLLLLKGLLLERDLGLAGRRMAGLALVLLFTFALALMMDMGVAFGTPLLFAYGLTAKSGDSGAYLAGRFLGRRKLIPHISPNKTKEGFVGGFVLTLAVAHLLFVVLGDGRFDTLEMLLLGIAVYLAGVLGDLLESILKRAAGEKDSGHLIPEFGGALDLLDSLVLPVPIAFALLQAFA